MTLRESLALTLGLDTALPLPQTTLTKLPKEKFMKGEWVVALDLCTRVGGGGLSLRASLNPEGKPEVESTEAAAQASQGFG